MSNNETTLLTSVFELACPHVDESNVNLTGAEYLDKSGADLIEVAGPVFEMLGLGEIDEQSTFGWRPTPRLIRIIAERAAGLTNESESNSAISLSDILTVLLTPAQGEAAPTYADDIADVLSFLGLGKKLSNGYCEPAGPLWKLILERLLQQHSKDK
jgi:hypothetical protein